MKFDVNFQTGTVTAEFSIEKFQEVMRVLAGTAPVPEAEPVTVRLPEVFTFHVRGYTQAYVCQDGEAFWVCSCPDFRYRKQSVPGDACKHIPQARLEYAQDSMARYRRVA